MSQSLETRTFEFAPGQVDHDALHEGVTRVSSFWDKTMRLPGMETFPPPAALVRLTQNVTLSLRRHAQRQ